MKTRRTEVRTYIVRWICEECEVGEMRPTGGSLASNPPLYIHKCNHCGHRDTARGTQYPQREYEEINPLTLEDFDERI